MQVRQVLLWIFRVNLGLALIGYGLAAVLSCTVASDAVRGCKRLPGIEPLITFLTLDVGWGLVFVGVPCLLLVRHRAAVEPESVSGSADGPARAI